MIYADDRRIGEHGIGRFARNVLGRLQYRRVSLTSDPDSPLDAWRLASSLKLLKSEDIFYSPGYNPPLNCPAPFAFTIHDLNHLDRPENSNLLKRFYYQTVIRRACHKASFVFTVSEFSRTRIIEWSGLCANKVIKIGCGVDSTYRPDGPIFKFDFPYLLCVSNRRGHKNEFRVLKAFAKAHISSNFKLVLTGNPTSILISQIEQLKLSDRVYFTNTVPDDEMPALYRGAHALVFVSLYEGFGLPVLEGMACGIPVLTSNVTALPEIAGGAALLVDPLVVSQIAQAIVEITDNKVLRLELRAKGLERAAQFTWTNVVATLHKHFLQMSAHLD